MTLFNHFRKPMLYNKTTRSWSTLYVFFLFCVHRFFLCICWNNATLLFVLAYMHHAPLGLRMQWKWTMHIFIKRVLLGANIEIADATVNWIDWFVDFCMVYVLILGYVCYTLWKYTLINYSPRLSGFSWQKKNSFRFQR